METFKLRQLHFHLKNNDSFLRFHRPNKYGDNLSKIRPTVSYVNKYHKKITGFEEGRIYSGYRFVYPMVYNEEYLGSVETSISMQGVILSLSSLLNSEVNFILNEKITVEKVFQEEKLNYKTYQSLQGHVIDTNYTQSKKLTRILQKSSKFSSQHLKNKTQKVLSFYEKINDIPYIISLISVNKALSDKPVAHFVILREHPQLYFTKMQKIIIISFIVLFLALLLYYMYKTEVKNQELILSAQKFKKLFNLQRNILVVSDGKKIKMANDSMCKFFGIDYLEFYTKYQNDISDRFIESPYYFNSKLIPSNSTWIEAIEPLIGDKRIVAMNDLNNNTHVFNVSVSKYEGNDFLILFTDISDTIGKKMNLNNKLMKDTLTGALSREFFEQNISTIIRNLNVDNSLGISLLDIDLFKAVNDTYGHDVGDTILKEFTKLIQSSIREKDYFIRWGGEEFIILTRASSLEALERVIENIRITIQNANFTQVKNLTCSFGITMYKDGEDIKEAIIRADRALYEAKGNNRNQVVTA